jgi:putative transposase
MVSRWKRHSAEDLVEKLRKARALVAKGSTGADAAAAIGVSYATLLLWNRRYAGMTSEQVRYVKSLEAEGARLRRAIAELEAESGAKTRRKTKRR